MEDIHFSCPICNGHIVIDGEGAGRDAPCPHCEKIIHIPSSVAEPAHASASASTETATEGLSFQKNPTEAWKSHTTDAEERSLLAHLGFDADPEESDGGEGAGQAGHGAHVSDVNFDQPQFKKKDQWFTENGKKYHYCYYDPGATEMKTACATRNVPVSADVAPDDTSKLKRHAYCKKCLQVLTAH